MKCCVSTDVGTWMNWLTFEPVSDYRMPEPDCFLHYRISAATRNFTSRKSDVYVLAPAATRGFTMVSFTEANEPSTVDTPCRVFFCLFYILSASNIAISFICMYIIAIIITHVGISADDVSNISLTYFCVAWRRRQVVLGHRLWDVSWFQSQRATTETRDKSSRTRLATQLDCNKKNQHETTLSGFILGSTSRLVFVTWLSGARTETRNSHDSSVTRDSTTAHLPITKAFFDIWNIASETFAG